MLSKIQNETKDLLENIFRLINELEGLQSIFGEENWKSPQSVLKEIIQPAKAGVLRLLNGDNIQRQKDLVSILSLDSVSVLLDQCNDDSYSHYLWKLDGSHDF
jgi:hypothetical protein